MELMRFAVEHDWAVLLPIVLCSLLVVAVALERWRFYRKNQRDVVEFFHALQQELQRNNLKGALEISREAGGVLGEVSEEGVRAMAERREGFDRSFDIAAALVARKLERNLPIVGTIATIAPYLGLFGTVVRILMTFGEMSTAAGSSAAPAIMSGIGSALIATAAGLAVAILAVALNNYFQTIVTRFEDDFQLLKLLFLSFVDIAPKRTEPAAPQPFVRSAAQRPRE
ncbi:MAG: MotA/TolQ/ExbB proton channel family protein [Candidatus Hydrogenedentes bacterium]|nr:MotA/TolQ/ExbB proton channel family protein [Candidatus Hydrogenedentota bacterium]